jgi:hypothetical protein
MEKHRPKKLLDQVRDAIRLKHYSYSTEQAYLGWIKRYIHFYGVRHPSEMGAPEGEAFLTNQAVNGHVATSTWNQALSALTGKRSVFVTGAAIPRSRCLRQRLFDSWVTGARYRCGKFVAL